MEGDEGRVPGHPRGPPVTIFLDGKPVRAYEGETVGAALHASGVAALSRSIKYHRPRGLFCCRGECAGCLMRVDGKPNLRTCMVPVAEGQRVESQNAFPSARRDLLAVVDKVYRKDFDYHAKFTRPRFLVPAYHWVIRRMAGFGRVPDTPRRQPRTRPIRILRPECVVVGAGAAGLAAAAGVASAGRRVLVVETAALAGGALLDHRGPLDGVASGPALADRLEGEVRKGGGDLRVATPAVGRYPDGVLTALAPDGLLEVHARALVVATGSHDVPPLFPGNDLPGVLSARGALTLLRRDGVLPGRRAVVLGEGAEAALAEAALRDAGVEVAAVVARAAAAEGSTRVQAVRLPDGARVACDTLVAASGRAPRPEIVQQTGCALRWDAAAGALVPVVDEDGASSVAGVWVCGDAARPKPVAENVAEGRRCGRAVARVLGGGA
ncbi:MAG TPA: 2Fe-2S iron-sulfur cluster-binding protein [Candidatus Thermoplasmatota archaeon]|nr:2Fe-2S iron-sulfur cluster-binding protein [Candidatus Thermoplasmatota archaeon]